jgi:hypothetical protein
MTQPRSHSALAGLLMDLAPILSLLAGLAVLVAIAAPSL